MWKAFVCVWVVGVGVGVGGGCGSENQPEGYWGVFVICVAPVCYVSVKVSLREQVDFGREGFAHWPMSGCCCCEEAQWWQTYGEARWRQT